MLVQAEQYEILAEYNNMARDRRQFKRFSKFYGPYKQNGVLDSHGGGQGISRATGKYAEHGSSSGGYKTWRRIKGVHIPNNPIA